MRSRDRITMGAGLAALATGTLAIGGASRWVVVVIAVFAAAAAASQINSRRRLAGVSPLLLLIGIAVGLTVLQIIPLPDAIVGALEPTGHELIVDGEKLGGSTAGWRPLSMDPGSTRAELAELAAYFLIAWMALRAATSERGRERLLIGVAGIAGVVAVVGLVHELLGADKLYGFYQPEHAHPVILAPLLNANHLACLMGLGALTATGLAFHQKRVPAIRAMWIAVALLCAGVLLSTTSRGAVMGLAAGATVVALTMVLQRLRAAPETKRGDVLRVALPAAIVVLCTLVLVIFLGGGRVGSQIEQTDLTELSDPRSKYAAWGSAIDLVKEAPILGVGRGAFQSAFTRIHPASAYLTFSHAENEYLQAAVDWGIGGAAALAGALTFGVLVALRRWRNGALAAASLGGLTAVAVQSTVDFGVELPGIAIPTIMVAATLLYVPLKEAARSPRRTALRTGVVLGVLAAAVLAALPASRTLGEDHDAFRADKPTLAEAHEAFERHPLDYLSAAYIAKMSTTNRDRLAYLNHALRLHPGHPDLHQAIARWLALTGHKTQAAIEFRLAMVGTDDPGVLVIQILQMFPAVDDAVEALPGGYKAWSLVVATLMQAKRNDVALAYLRKIVDTPGAKPTGEVWRKIATLSEAAGDLALAERAAAALAVLSPSTAASLELAKLQVRRKEYDAAIATLTPLVGEVVTSTDHVEAHVLLCEVQIARLDWAGARACLDRALLLPAVSMDVRRQIHGDLAKVHDALGNKTEADFNRQLSAPGRLKSEQPRSQVDGTGQLR